MAPPAPPPGPVAVLRGHKADVQCLLFYDAAAAASAAPRTPQPRAQHPQPAPAAAAHTGDAGSLATHQVVNGSLAASPGRGQVPRLGPHASARSDLPPRGTDLLDSSYLLLSGDAEGELRVWSVADQRPLLARRLHPLDCGILALSLIPAADLAAMDAPALAAEGAARPTAAAAAALGQTNTAAAASEASALPNGSQAGTHWQSLHDGNAQLPACGLAALAGSWLASQGRDGSVRLWRFGPNGSLPQAPAHVIETGAFGFCKHSILLCHPLAPSTCGGAHEPRYSIVRGAADAAGAALSPPPGASSHGSDNNGAAAEGAVASENRLSVPTGASSHDRDGEAANSGSSVESGPAQQVPPASAAVPPQRSPGLLSRVLQSPAATPPQADYTSALASAFSAATALAPDPDSVQPPPHTQNDISDARAATSQSAHHATPMAEEQQVQALPEDGSSTAEEGATATAASAAALDPDLELLASLTTSAVPRNGDIPQPATVLEGFAVQAHGSTGGVEGTAEQARPQPAEAPTSTAPAPPSAALLLLALAGALVKQILVVIGVIRSLPFCFVPDSSVDSLCNALSDENLEKHSAVNSFPYFGWLPLLQQPAFTAALVGWSSQKLSPKFMLQTLETCCLFPISVQYSLHLSLTQLRLKSLIFE